MHFLVKFSKIYNFTLKGSKENYKEKWSFCSLCSSLVCAALLWVRTKKNNDLKCLFFLKIRCNTGDNNINNSRPYKYNSNIYIINNNHHIKPNNDFLKSSKYNSIKGHDGVYSVDFTYDSWIFIWNFVDEINSSSHYS